MKLTYVYVGFFVCLFFFNVYISLGWCRQVVVTVSLSLCHNALLQNTSLVRTKRICGCIDKIMNYSSPSPVSCCLRNKVELVELDWFKREISLSRQIKHFCHFIAAIKGCSLSRLSFQLQLYLWWLLITDTGDSFQNMLKKLNSPQRIFFFYYLCGASDISLCTSLL